MSKYILDIDGPFLHRLQARMRALGLNQESAVLTRRREEAKKAMAKKKRAKVPILKAVSR